MPEVRTIYNLKVYYPVFRKVSGANTDKCRIKELAPGIWQYSFEDAILLGKWDWGEPLLRVEEVILGGELVGLKFTIDSWDGSYLGDIVWGSNELPIWTAKELTLPPSSNVGKQRYISLVQIKNPTIVAEEPPVPKTWWERLPWYAKGAFIGSPILLGAIYIWKKVK